MQPYSVKLTIEGLYGAFAEKYACLIRDAHHVHRLLLQLGAKAPEGPISIAQPHPQQTTYDPIALLARLMRYLRKVASEQPQRRFFTGVRFEPADGSAPSSWLPSAQGQDASGPFTLHAWGLHAFLSRDADAPDPLAAPPTAALNLTTEPDPSYATPAGRFVCQYEPIGPMFRPILTALVEVCEDALAKNQNLLATQVPHQPGPPPRSAVDY